MLKQSLLKLLILPCSLIPWFSGEMLLNNTVGWHEQFESIIILIPAIFRSYKVCHVPEKILSAAKEIRTKSSLSRGGQSTPAFRPAAKSLCAFTAN